MADGARGLAGKSVRYPVADRKRPRMTPRTEAETQPRPRSCSNWRSFDDHQSLNQAIRKGAAMQGNQMVVGLCALMFSISSCSKGGKGVSEADEAVRLIRVKIPSAHLLEHQPRWHPVSPPLPETEPLDLMKLSPKEFLEELTLRTQPVSLRYNHYGWIELEDVDQILHLIDSDQACAAVVMQYASSYDPSARSTVGVEARFIIAGYVLGVYPPSLTSSTDFGPEVEEWINERRKQQRH